MNAHFVRTICCCLIAVCMQTWGKTDLSVVHSQDIPYQLAMTGTQDKEVTLPTILAQTSQYPFIKVDAHYGAGWRYEATWLKFYIEHVDRDSSLVLQFYYPGRLQLHYQDVTGTWHQRDFGGEVKLQDRDLSNLRSAALLGNTMDMSRPFYVKIYQKGTNMIGHRLLPLAEVTKLNQREDYLWGAILGLVTLALVTGLVMFAFTQQKAYLYFSGICLGSILWSVTTLQIAHHIDSRLYQQGPYYQMIDFIICILGISIIQFMRHYVQFHRFAPRFDQSFRLSAVGYGTCYLIMVIFAFQMPDADWPRHLSSIVVFISGSLAIIGLCMGVFSKDRASIVMACAWIPGSSIAVISIPTYYGVIPGTWLTENIVTLGLAAAVLLFSIALADQIFQLRQQRNELITRSNLELQQQVAGQTAHLTLQNKKIEQQRQVLATTLSYKEDLLANIAHELKTPLTLILGVLTGKYDDNERQRKLKRLVFRISQLIDNMLDLSKTKSQSKQEQATFVYRAQEFVEFYLTTYRGFVPEGRLVLEANSAAEVICAPDTLDKIITNLINNAIKYSPPDTPIEIAAAIVNRQWQLAVKNQGKGIAPEQLKSVFERYVQVGEANQSYGLGLGLPLVKQLVEAAGGEISIASQPEKDTCVTISLPLAPKPTIPEQTARGVSYNELSEEHRNWLYAELQQTEPPAATSSVVLPEDSNKALLYCIDDNLELLEQLREQLGGRYHMVCFDDPLEALSAAEVTLPDLLLCDVMMPQLSGFDVIQRVRKHELLSHIPVVLLTARGDHESKTRGLTVMADDYITKPYEPQALALKVDNLIAIRGLLKARFTVTLQHSEQLQSQHHNSAVLFSDCPPAQRQFMQKVVDCFQAHLSEPEFAIRDLSKALHLSDSQIRRKVKAISGYSPQEVLRIIRVEAAAKLIRSGQSLKVVAHQCGFSSQSHMGATFKAYFGKTPNQYRDLDA